MDNWGGGSSVTYKILINGSPSDQIIPTRGLHGDHISPYLFLICMEGLTIKLKLMEVINSIQRIKIKRTSPTISHLLFAYMI